jgi:hypothetical protein
MKVLHRKGGGVLRRHNDVEAMTRVEERIAALCSPVLLSGYEGAVGLRRDYPALGTIAGAAFLGLGIACLETSTVQDLE